MILKNMKLSLLSFILCSLVQISFGFICSFCPDQLRHTTKYIYVNTTPCFAFGDCIDKGQDDNTFWISQLDAYLRQSTAYLSRALKRVERRVYHQRDEGNVTVFDGTAEQMCMPSQLLSQNSPYLKKMHSAFRLSEMARKCKIMTMDLIAQVLARLEGLYEGMVLKLVSDKDALDAVCDARIDVDRRGRNCSN